MMCTIAFGDGILADPAPMSSTPAFHVAAAKHSLNSRPAFRATLHLELLEKIFFVLLLRPITGLTLMSDLATVIADDTAALRAAK